VTKTDNQANKKFTFMKKRTAYCPVDYAFQRVGGKYKGRILWFLREESLRYGELKRAVEGISTKMLTQALKELEEDGLVLREEYLEMPPRVQYSLTKSGEALIPSINQFRIWGEMQMASSPVSSS
jgi:DNA-binding HxlR family transcriptional regulator